MAGFKLVLIEHFLTWDHWPRQNHYKTHSTIRETNIQAITGGASQIQPRCSGTNPSVFGAVPLGHVLFCNKSDAFVFTPAKSANTSTRYSPGNITWKFSSAGIVNNTTMAQQERKWQTGVGWGAVRCCEGDVGTFCTLPKELGTCFNGIPDNINLKLLACCAHFTVDSFSNLG